MIASICLDDGMASSSFSFFAETEFFKHNRKLEFTDGLNKRLSDSVQIVVATHSPFCLSCKANFIDLTHIGNPISSLDYKSIATKHLLSLSKDLSA